MKAPICPYCKMESILVSANVVYPHRPDLSGNLVWLCVADHAWVGCHKGTPIPLGRLANAELRKWKQRAHEAFDPFWLRETYPRMARHEAYVWLASQLGLSINDTHIGMFDIETCARAITACARRKEIEDANRKQNRPLPPGRVRLHFAPPARPPEVH